MIVRLSVWVAPEVQPQEIYIIDRRLDISWVSNNDWLLSRMVKDTKGIDSDIATCKCKSPEKIVKFSGVGWF